MLKRDIETTKVKIASQEQTIKNQQDLIKAQEKTVELARNMESTRDAVLDSYTKRMSVKLNDTNELIKKIQTGGFQPATCEPSESVKAIIEHIQGVDTK